MTQSSLERSFAYHWRILGGPQLEREYRFAAPRRYRLDFAHPASRVAIECQGGIWVGGRHTSGSGFQAEALKRNLAASMGWAWFEITSDMLAKDPAGAIEPIIETINERMRDDK